jgi:hypothetical protein
MRSTQYFSGPMFRGDLKTKDMEFISIVNGKTLINCQRPNSSGEKWSCTKGDIEQIGTVMGVAKIKVRDQKLKKLKKTGRFIGRSCQYYHRNLTLDINVMGITTTSKSSDRLCVDQSIRVPVNTFAYQMMTLLRGSMSKKDMKKFLSEAEKIDGLLLYQESQVDASTQVELVQSVAKIFGGDSRAKQKSTVITKTLSVNKKRLPKSLFQLPRDVDQVTDLTKKSAP